MTLRQKHPFLFSPPLLLSMLVVKVYVWFIYSKLTTFVGSPFKFIKIIFFVNIKRKIRHYLKIFLQLNYLLPGRHLLRATTSVDPEHDSPGQHPVLQDLQQGQVRAGPRCMRTRGGSQDLDWRWSDRDWREGTLIWQEKFSSPKDSCWESLFQMRKIKQQWYFNKPLKEEHIHLKRKLLSDIFGVLHLSNKNTS